MALLLRWASSKEISCHIKLKNNWAGIDTDQIIKQIKIYQSYHSVNFNVVVLNLSKTEWFAL